MSFTPTPAAEVLAVVGKFIEQIRPRPEVRDQLDFRADISGAEVVLSEVRPRRGAPEQLIIRDFARLRWFKTRKLWRLYWKRASGKWELYTPEPIHDTLEQALHEVRADRHGCFFG